MDHSHCYAQVSGSRSHGSPHPSSSSPQPDREDVKSIITPTTPVSAASAPHPSSSTNPRKRPRRSQEPDRGPDREQKQTKHRLRAAERRAKQSQSLAELSALLPDTLQLYQDKADLRVVPQVITYIHQLRDQVADLESKIGEEDATKVITYIHELRDRVAEQDATIQSLESALEQRDVERLRHAAEKCNLLMQLEVFRLEIHALKRADWNPDSASMGTMGRPVC